MSADDTPTPVVPNPCGTYENLAADFAETPPGTAKPTKSESVHQSTTESPKYLTGTCIVSVSNTVPCRAPITSLEMPGPSPNKSFSPGSQSYKIHRKSSASGMGPVMQKHNPLPTTPTKGDRFKYAFTCPPHGMVGAISLPLKVTL
ncbi:uncharacterized protein LOC108673675 [Hyalella azteca]|uniref:Uncharacterized protein LOC108673675 n=1 Tax=Hyalella azteca TaxID=294128 RepID=A0A8B7NTI3_HYAAZ|nr:uncharacterized protein LOC108673675 [Hyalella azteca]